MSGRFEDLMVWQAAMELVYVIYDLTAKYPKDELYGLVSQVRRAAVSIPSNIAEGKGRFSDKEFVVFLCHARGSTYELQTQCLIARHMNYFSEQDFETLADRVANIGKMLNGLISYASSSAQS
jgi:four helix bundle protein